MGCKSPHSFVINLMSLGGASGSPVFLAENGHVIGILNAGLTQQVPLYTKVEDSLQPTGLVPSSTNFTYVVPAYYLASTLKHIRGDKQFALPPGTPTLQEIIERVPASERKGSGQIKPIRERCEPSDGTVFDVHVEPVSWNESKKEDGPSTV